MILLRALLGIVFLLAVAWGLSSNRRRFPWRVVLGGILLQLAIAGLLLETGVGRGFFEGLARFVTHLVGLAEPGAKTVFGPLGDSNSPIGFVFAFAGTGLVVIIFVSALMSVLYHLGVMQVLVWLLAKVMRATMGLSGAESMAAAANIFMGMTEAPLVVRPYVAKMTLSELNALMTGGFATIAGSVMVVYMARLGPGYAEHLITASVMSAPAAFVMAKIIRPETDEALTSGRVELKVERTSTNLIEAAATGTTDGLRLWLNVIAMLIAFLALVNLVNWPITALGEYWQVEGGLSLQRILGFALSPVAWFMGADGAHDCRMLGELMGTQISVNEFVAFLRLRELEPGQAGDVFESARTAHMAVYALCGFANFGSIGIQLGGISALAPERRGDLARLALKAMLGGAMACWMTAVVASLFLS
ncbi:MAG: NupC/NupG family nucleoside CNT transporter [Planctomycetes bacterium]|nr:NupC/NupG family nucleoside CNT transporter [Planctomycetota bacterium]